METLTDENHRRIDHVIRCLNIKYKTTRKYLRVVNTEDEPEKELFFEVTGSWFGKRWFTNQSLVTKKMIFDTTGFTVEEWEEQVVTYEEKIRLLDEKNRIH